MIRVLLVALPVLLFGLPSSARSMWFDPPSPLADETVRIFARGTIDGPGCAAGLFDPVVEGREIRVAVRSLALPITCPTGPIPWIDSIAVGPLAPGAYTVRIVPEGGGEPQLTAPLIVRREDGRHPVVPFVGPTSGGREVRITVPVQFGRTGCAPLRVFFGGTESSEVRLSGLDAAVVIPPHEPGAVDIRLTAPCAAASIEGAFLYYDPDLEPPATAFSPVLFPAMFEGEGALGSYWTTEAVVHNEGATDVYTSTPFLECASEPCAPSFPAGETVRIRPDDVVASPGGLLIWVPSDQIERLHFSLRVRDLSRQAESLGTEIPVLSADGLLTGSFTTGGSAVLPDVPLDPRFRHMIRVYGVDQPAGWVVVESAIDRRSYGSYSIPSRKYVQCGIAPCSYPEPWYAQVDLAKLLPLDVPTGERLRITIRGVPGSRFWGYVAVTNNETQQVTTVTPQSFRR